MKPSELRPLVGKKVGCFWNGERVGLVRGVPASDHLAVRFVNEHRTHKIALDAVRGVYWYGKLRPVLDFVKRSETTKE